MPTLPHQQIFLHWINFIIQAVPVRLAATFTELLLGTIMARSGHITQALLQIGHSKHFTTYYWLLEKAKWSWLAVSKQLITLILKFFPRQEWNLIVDDFICPRSSKKAPHVKYHFDHSQKPNRPQFLWGQQWLAVGLSLSWGKMVAALPLVLRLHKHKGNSTKLTGAVAIIRTILPLFKKSQTQTLRVLVDAWFMKANFILPLVKRGIKVIGQVRKDTALFLMPENTTSSSRGRPRKYGSRITEQLIEKMPIAIVNVITYGSVKQIKYRYIKCLARFLNGLPVIALWCQLPDQSNWTLIITTDLSLTPERIIKLYGRRWKIEPMFNEIKHSYGVAQAWEQSTKALYRWVSILCVAYSLTRMLSLLFKSSKDLTILVPWRKKAPITAGLVRGALELFIRRYGFAMLWQPKSKKLILPYVRNWPLKATG
jgi:hypothetical protein